MTTTLQSIKNGPQAASLPSVSVGFGNSQSFELMQRVAKMLSSSTLVPAQFRAFDDKKGENPNALANCMVALNMAQRMGANELMVMQNLYIVEGRPSWSSQWIMASINSSGKFSPLRFDIKDLGEKEVEYTVTTWGNNRERITKTHKALIKDKVCIAWAIERETGERVESPPISIEMATKEGWYGKNGSKWQTMPDVMLRYRAASFFGRIYAPELLMGLRSVEEAQDEIVLDAVVIDDKVTVDELREATPTPKPKATAKTAKEVEVTDVEPSISVQADADGVVNANADSDKATYDRCFSLLTKATNQDELDVAIDQSNVISDQGLKDKLLQLYKERSDELSGNAPVLFE